MFIILIRFFMVMMVFVCFDILIGLLFLMRFISWLMRILRLI